MLCGGFLCFFKELPVPGISKKINQNQRTGQFLVLQNSKSKEPLVLSIFKTLKEPPVFNKQL
jgi:hypothetical protein